MIAGYAEAAIALENPAYAARAERAAGFLLRNLRTRDGRLLRTYSARPNEKGEARLNGYLEDYACLTHGLLRLHAATGKKQWLDEAVALTDTMVTWHQDKERGGFYFTSHDHEELFARAKDQYDGATPSGNSVAARNLVLLTRALDKSATDLPRFQQLAEQTLKAFSTSVRDNPSSMTLMLQSLSLWLDTQENKAFKLPMEPDPDPAQAKPKPEDLVKIAARLSPEKPGTDGKQTVLLTLDIAKGWHTYANPSGNESLLPTTVQVAGQKAKLEEVKVEYPPGTELKEPMIEQPIRVYEGKTTIKVHLRRPLVDGKPDTGPLEVAIRYQVCSDSRCLLPKTVKLVVGE
jgi:hypothetical protein